MSIVCRSRKPLFLFGIVVLAALLAGCPLPYEFSGEGAGQLTSGDPSSPSVTAPVQFAFSESAGPSGTIPSGQSATTGSDTLITLSSDTSNVVIYFTQDGSAPDPQSNNTQRYNGAISLAIDNPAVNNDTASLTINALAVGPNMRPSPVTNATVAVDYQITPGPAPMGTPSVALSSLTSFVLPSSNVRISRPDFTIVDIDIDVDPFYEYDPANGQRIVFEIARLDASSNVVGDTIVAVYDPLNESPVNDIQVNGLSQLNVAAISVRQRTEVDPDADGTFEPSTDWSAPATVSFQLDQYNWASRTAPSNVSQLRNAVSAANEQSPWNFIDLRPLGTNTLALGNGGPLSVNNVMHIIGDGTPISGSNTDRVFEIGGNGSLILEGLVIRDGVSNNGSAPATQNWQSGGGGGAGYGGGILIHVGGSLTLKDSELRNNEARGGNGANGGSTATYDNSVTSGGDGGGLNGASGGEFVDNAGQAGGSGNNGSDFNGGGGGGINRSSLSVSDIGGPGGNGGAGGYGAGGGGAGAVSGSWVPGQPGAAGTYGGQGGNAGNRVTGGGGGGAGLGGAIFINAGGSLTLQGTVTFTGNSAIGGSGGTSTGGISNPGGNGQGLGSAIFMRNGGTAQIDGISADNSNVSRDGDSPDSGDTGSVVEFEGQSPPL